MNASENALKLIQAFEGILDGDKSTPNFEPYIDVAHIYTVGWGHALFNLAGQLIDVDVFGPVRAAALARAAMVRKFGKYGLTREECETLFEADIARFDLGLSKQIDADTTQAQFDALVSFSFNVGLGNFATSAVKRLHNAHQRTVPAISMPDLCGKAKSKAAPLTMSIAFARWCNAKGKFTLGLFRRRMAELLIYDGVDEPTAYSMAMAFHD